MLLLPTAHGAYPAAGLPWFSCIFGRDALITTQMLLPWRPELAASVLDQLAAEQGKVVDPFREEEPGKILHEMRRGELSRTGRIPFGRYFGSVDATALFVVAMGSMSRPPATSRASSKPGPPGRARSPGSRRTERRPETSWLSRLRGRD
jgi:glycogen debranching enzyme